MVEGVRIENMKVDDELDMLLGEIPHVIDVHHTHNGQENHYNLVDHASYMSQIMNAHGVYDDELLRHRYACASSPVTANGFSLQSDGPSSSLMSSLYPISDNVSPTRFEKLNSHLGSGYNLGFGYMRVPSNNMVDEQSLARNLSSLYIREDLNDISIPPNGFQFCDPSMNGRAIRVNSDRYWSPTSSGYGNQFSGCGMLDSSVPRSDMHFEGYIGSGLVGMQHDYRGTFAPPYSPGGNCGNSQFCATDLQAGSYLPSSLNRASLADNLFYGPNGTSVVEDVGAFHPPNVLQLASLMPQLNAEKSLKYLPNIRPRMSSHIEMQHGIEGIAREYGLILQGEGLGYVSNRGNGHSRAHNTKGLRHENVLGRPQEKLRQLDSCGGHVSEVEEIGRGPSMGYPVYLPSKGSSLVEARGYIYYMARDQNGCRFLQRVFDEGTPQDMQIIFCEIIDRVVELMMNPFGNYLTQKLLEVCNEEQRTQVLVRATQVPGRLITISLNTHGTRVVQKMIETLHTREQIQLLVSALEPGFLALIKDLNGNHVIQRCLQCLSNEDNEFIFVAAAKYCVDIATHQQGCCVLQCCISYSTGQHLNNLTAQISANALLLAQDAFGNYVVQFLLELKVPSTTSQLTTQFEGNYVHLSVQKFSSHVVEKCLMVCNEETRSKIIHELLCAPNFEHLLQDPHANYVVQTALQVSQGRLHDSLVKAVESHKAISRNSPYSKRIFSHKLLKK